MKRIACPQNDPLEIEAERARGGQMMTEQVFDLIGRIVKQDQTLSEAIQGEENELQGKIGELDRIIGIAREQQKAKANREKAEQELAVKKGLKKPLEETLAEEEKKEPETEEKSAQLALIRGEMPEYEQLDKELAGILAAEKRQKEKETEIESLKGSEKKLQDGLEKLREEQKELKAAGDRSAELEVEKERISAQKTALDNLKKELDELPKKQQAMKTAQDKYLAARKAAEECRQEAERTAGPSMTNRPESLPKDWRKERNARSADPSIIRIRRSSPRTRLTRLLSSSQRRRLRKPGKRKQKQAEPPEPRKRKSIWQWKASGKKRRSLSGNTMRHGLRPRLRTRFLNLPRKRT